MPRYTFLMPDWKLIAAGRGLNLSSEELERIAPVLDALQATLQSKLRAIPLATEPIIAFQCTGEEQDT